MQVSSTRIEASWRPFRTIRPGGFPGHPILPFKPSLVYQSTRRSLFYGNLGHLGKPFPWLVERFRSYMSENIEQPLPSTFEEFNEQRKAAFIRVKDYKQAGNRLVGFLCSYTPLEIIDAAGAASVALCGTSDEVIPEAEKVLPANLCPLIKSTYGFAYSQKCPFTYFSDMIIGETTCDGKKKMYELLNELKRTHILHLPQGRDRAYEREGWYEECRLLKEELENFYGIAITDDDLRAAVRRRNRLRAAQLEMFALQANQPAAMSGVDLDEHHVCRYVQL